MVSCDHIVSQLERITISSMIAQFINRFVSHRCLLQESASDLIHDIISSNHWLIREDSIDIISNKVEQ